jgi:hypothetical protein
VRLPPFPLPCNSQNQTSKANKQGTLLISSAWLAFVITMISVSIIKLSETKPARTSVPLPSISFFSPFGAHHSSLALVPMRKLIIVMQVLAALLFAGSQIVFLLVSEPLCNVSYLPHLIPPLKEDELMNRRPRGRSIVPSYVLYYRLLVW